MSDSDFKDPWARSDSLAASKGSLFPSRGTAGKAAPRGGSARARQQRALRRARARRSGEAPRCSMTATEPRVRRWGCSGGRSAALWGRRPVPLRCCRKNGCRGAMTENGGRWGRDGRRGESTFNQTFLMMLGGWKG